MTDETLILALSAASIAFFHTVFGPDHYLPFIAMAKARRWNLARTLGLTFACGLGHVLSSVLLGLAGLLFGVVIFNLETIESLRGSFAAWMLIIFGFSYFAWGLSRLRRSRFHSHSHETHQHGVTVTDRVDRTSWALVMIFVLGPCEPLIPLLMYPAARSSWLNVAIVTAVFGVVTIGTMLGLVVLAYYGLSRIRLQVAEKYTHVLAGLVILLSGIAIKFLGL